VVIGLDVLVTDGEEREGPVLGELRVAIDDGQPRGLDGAPLGKLEVHPSLPGGFTIPGEQVDPDTHGENV
jgi:hypothetical protein